jgi:lipoyl-dependent peroxiredoxin
MTVTMSRIQKVTYTARVHATGGRNGGMARSSDGRLEVNLTLPGSFQSGTNPEQLLAAGWSTSFLSALELVAGKMKATLPREAAVDVELDLGTASNGFFLQARINVHLPGVDYLIAETLIDAAHQTCPYSRAMEGNIDVTLTVT